MLRTRDIQPRGGKTNPPRTEAAPGKHRRGKKAPKRDGGGGSTGNSPLRFPAAGPDKQRCWLRRRGFSAFSPPRPPFTGSAGPGLPPSLLPRRRPQRRRELGPAAAAAPLTAGSGSTQPLRNEPGRGGPGAAKGRPSPPSGPYRAAGQAPPRREDSRPSGPGPAPPAAASSSSTSVVAGEGPAEAG